MAPVNLYKSAMILIQQGKFDYITPMMEQAARGANNWEIKGLIPAGQAGIGNCAGDPAGGIAVQWDSSVDCDYKPASITDE